MMCIVHVLKARLHTIICVGHDMELKIQSTFWYCTCTAEFVTKSTHQINI